MSAVARPSGLKPVMYLGGRPYNGAVQKFKMTASYGTSIAAGDVVKLAAAGTVEKDTGTDACTPLGVFVGCTYTDPTNGRPTWSQVWIASTAASDNWAHVTCDPELVYQLQANGTVAQTVLGANTALVQTAPDTTLKISRVSMNYSSANTTNTLPIKVVGFVEGPNSAVGDAYTDCLVVFNRATHQFSNPTGVA